MKINRSHFFSCAAFPDLGLRFKRLGPNRDSMVGLVYTYPSLSRLCYDSHLTGLAHSLAKSRLPAPSFSAAAGAVSRLSWEKGREPKVSVRVAM